MSLRSFAICTASLFVSSVCAVAGSAAGGGAQIAPTDNASVSTYKATDTSVGASARDSAGASSLSSGGSSSSSSSSGSSAGASSTDASSSSGSTSSNGGAPSGFGIGPHGAKNSNDVAAEIAREKVIDTGDKGLEIDQTAKTKPTDKTFAPGLLDTVNDISKVSAQKEQGAVSKDQDSQSEHRLAAPEKDKDDSQKKN